VINFIDKIDIYRVFVMNRDITSYHIIFGQFSYFFNLLEGKRYSVQKVYIS